MSIILGPEVMAEIRGSTCQISTTWKNHYSICILGDVAPLYTCSKTTRAILNLTKITVGRFLFKAISSKGGIHPSAKRLQITGIWRGKALATGDW